MKSRKLALTLAVATSAVAIAVGPSAASADTYAPQPDAQTFATSAGGWTSSTNNEVLCIPALTCPIVTNSFQPSGGAGGVGDGFLRTSIIGLVAAATTTNAVWESPAFTYTGNGGAAPTTATFTMDRRSNVTALLGVVGNTATYNVRLFDVTAGTGLTIVAPTTLAGADNWTAIPAVSINPSQLILGHQYRIQVTSSFTNMAGVSVIPMGSADYDNVRLSTAGGPGPGGPTNSGSSITNTTQLTQLILSQSSGLPNSATLTGRTLRLKVKCPKAAAPLPCNYVLQGLAKGRKSKPATRRKKTAIRAGATKKVVIKVKPKFLAKYQRARKVFVKARVTVGNVKVTVVKKMKLIH